MYTDSRVFRVLVAIVLVASVLWASPAGAAIGGEGISVTVSGRQINGTDLDNLTKGILIAHPREIDKVPSDMPAIAPLIYYAGNGVIWRSKTVNQDLGAWSRVAASAQPAEDAFVAAAALAAMDAGTEGQPWENIIHRSPSDQASRLALGKSIAEAFKTASDQAEAFTSSQIAWIRLHILSGMSRENVYDLLKTRGLVAYNPAYAPQTEIAKGRCTSIVDPESGTWPYPNEPLPRKSAACAFVHSVTPIAHPEAMIYLTGAFGLGCSQDAAVTIGFDKNDRVTKTAIDSPEVGCI